MKDKKIRWMLSSITAAVLFAVGSIRLYSRNDLTGSLIYAVAGIVFILIAFGRAKGS